MGDLFAAENFVVILAFIAAFAAVMAIALPLMRRDPRSVRMESVAKRREELSREQRAALGGQQNVRWRPQAPLPSRATLAAPPAETILAARRRPPAEPRRLPPTQTISTSASGGGARWRCGVRCLRSGSNSRRRRSRSC